MIFRNRRAVSMAAAALLASGAFTALGAPAHAAGTETDLAVTAAGTRVTSGVVGKVAWVKIANQGKGTPSKVPPDGRHVQGGRGQARDGGLHLRVRCAVPRATRRPGLFFCELATGDPRAGRDDRGSADHRSRPPKGVTEPYSAPVTISIESADDTDESNNSIEVDIELTPESGVDLGVFVPDVKTRFDLDTGEEGPLRSGRHRPPLSARSSTRATGPPRASS